MKPRTIVLSFACGLMAAGLLVGLGWALAPRGYSEADVAHARREAGDSATAEVSAQYLNEMVKPLRDSLAAFHGKPEAAATVVVTHKPVQTASAVAYIPPADTTPAHDTATVTFAPETHGGITIAERLDLTPAPTKPTRILRHLQLTIAPDSILVALLRQPDGTRRFAALASGQGYAKVTDAAVLPNPHTSGLSKIASLSGTAACAAEASLLTAQATGDLTLPWYIHATGGVLCGLHILREATRR